MVVLSTQLSSTTKVLKTKFYKLDYTIYILDDTVNKFNRSMKQPNIILNRCSN